MNEKVNDTIVNKLRLAIQDHPRRKWSTLLPQVVKDYNNTIHSTTGFKPAFLMFGIDSDNQIPSIEARALAKVRTESFKIKKKAEYDKHHIPINFNIGDLIRRRIPPNHPSNTKLSPKFEGPFKIIEKTLEVNYRIQNLGKKEHNELVHVNKLESYHTREDSQMAVGE
jgi:hypothetical protein